MAKLNVLLSIATVFNLVANVYPSEGDIEINFDKPSEESDEYHFKYKLSDGHLHDGKTLKLINRIHVMGGANNIVYWVQIGEEEMDKDEFKKVAHVAQRRKNKIFFEDQNHVKYLFDVTNGHLFVTLHDTAWDVDNICFIRNKTEDHIFDFTISSINNSRKFNGTTHLVADDPLIQRIDVLDEEVSHGEYEIKFIESELSTNETFCRGITRIISGNQWGLIPIDKIDRNCLLSCIG